MRIRNILLILIFIFALAVRFYRLGDVPVGFHQDEISQAYNAFSILETMRDRYGQFSPILFRSFGSYQPPVYTYLSAISIFLFGNTIFAARFVSALFGSLMVILTYLIVKILATKKYQFDLALVSAFIVGISPWSIHFSRRVVEGTLGLFFFMLAFYLFLLSLRKINYFLLACLTLGIATHAYYSERLISVIFLPFFLIYFKTYFLKYKTWVVVGLLVFGLTLIPHIVTVYSGAFGARFNQVTDKSIQFSPIEFGKHMAGYLSPRNLFNDTGNGLARVSPNLSVFYDWFFVSFLLGLYFFTLYIDRKFWKFIGILTVIFLIPVSLTGDIFYPLRALEYFWVLSVVIAVGTLKFAKNLIFPILIIYSLVSFYVSYFVLFQHEASENMGNTYLLLSRELMRHSDYKVVLDSARDPAAGLRIAYFRKYDPVKLQSTLKTQLVTPYYSSEVNTQEIYVVDNIEARPIDWKKDRCSAKTILVGDKLAFSQEQITEHRLKLLFEVEGVNKDIVLKGYETNPDEKCKNKI